MQVKEIIKELDPDYGKCAWCRRWLYISKLAVVRSVRNYYVCLDVQDCNKHNDLHE